MEPRPEYPRPRLTRPNWINLNGEWEFGAGERPVFDRRIVVPFCPQSELSGIGEAPGDTVWYRRRFDAPPGERLILHCGAVDYRATVWLNDVSVARQPWPDEVASSWTRSRPGTLTHRRFTRSKRRCSTETAAAGSSTGCSPISGCAAWARITAASG